MLVATLDVHGLHRDEATEASRQWLRSLRSSDRGEDGSGRWACIVVGSGAHSRPGERRLSDALCAALRERSHASDDTAFIVLDGFGPPGQRDGCLLVPLWITPR